MEKRFLHCIFFEVEEDSLALGNVFMFAKNLLEMNVEDVLRWYMGGSVKTGSRKRI